MSTTPEFVDAVVVGSGFGGSVAAYRMAQAGRSVVLLERGRAWPPGSFARTPAEMTTNFWDPSEGQYGLFDVWTFRGLEGVVASGLGGGSLIYANVLLRKDEKWFVEHEALPGGGYESWPVTRADLDPHYDAVEDMIGVAPYPYAETTPKTQAMQRAAAGAGLEFLLPPLAVSFARRPGEPPLPRAELPLPAYGNVHGLPRQTCRLCGECDLGCNDGAKNTLDHTYLSAAAHEGADLRTGCEVRGVLPLPGGGYEVRYEVRTEPFIRQRRTIRCERLFLAAGTFGTTYLLLRNVSALPALSRAALGTRFSGNGDLLTFLMNATEYGERRPLHASRGPVITSAIRVGDRVDGADATGRGHYVEDAGYPGFTDWLVEAAQPAGLAARGASFAVKRLHERLTDSPDSSIGADLAALIGGGALSNSSLPLLGMGRDIADGVMSLRDSRLAIDWTTSTSRDYFSAMHATMREIAEHLQASFHDNPMWLTHRVITVHPLGGAPMAADPGTGVCDPWGEVYGHPGLHVVDGALMPGPVGANPSLTIAALADRACTRVLETSPNGALLHPLPAPAATPAPVAGDPGLAHTRISFTETMRGFLTLGESDCQSGHDRGRDAGHSVMFELTITTDDIERFVTDAAHAGSATGYLHSDVLGGRFEVEQGWFNLFVADEPGTRRMLYRLWLRGPGGNPLTFTGVKLVRDDPGFDTWRDTSTLYVRVLPGHRTPDQDEDAQALGAGIITIHLPDFARQLTTFRASGGSPLSTMERFGRFFLGQLWQVYGAALGQEAAQDASVGTTTAGDDR